MAFAVLAATFPTVASTRPAPRSTTSARLCWPPASPRIVLVTTLGGTTLAWDSPAILGLAVAGVAALAAFFLVERRAAEPVLPPRLWRNRTFRVTSAVGLIIGFSLFGAVTFLPLFLQVVRGAEPDRLGPAAAAADGRADALVGDLRAPDRPHRPLPPVPDRRHRPDRLGLLLLSRMGPGTAIPVAAAFMAVLGLGLGMVMQVLILAVQNDAPYEDLGVATAGATLFRSIGGSLGTATLGRRVREPPGRPS